MERGKLMFRDTTDSDDTFASSLAVISRELLERVQREEETETVTARLSNLSQEEMSLLRTSREVALSFWLNVYNAAGQLLLARKPSLYDSKWRFFRTTAITVSGNELSLDDIEHGLIRGNRSKYGFGYLPRLVRTGFSSAYLLDIDPRIHFALNCGAASCPLIRPYDPETVDETLDMATSLDLEQTVTFDREKGIVRVPRTMLWNIGDFGGRSGIIEFLKRYDQLDDGLNPRVRFVKYDWTKTPRKFAEID